MSTVRQIAREAGVSITTVSRVLNNHPRVSDQAREKVLAAANKARYVATVGKRSTTTIALIYTGELALGSPFDAALMEGMAGAMEEFDFDLMVLDANRVRQPHETYSQMFMRKGIRGAILRSSATAREAARMIGDEGFPAVVLGDRFEHDSLTFVGSDSRQASQEAVEHLMDLGHRRIGVVTNVEDDYDHLERLAGYRAALEAAGVKFDRSLVYRVPAHRVGGVTFMNRFASMSNRPTALFFLDPITGVAAINQAAAHGIEVPDDLSVVGFDDFEWRYMVRPSLTAVCQDAVALGRSAFQALHNVMQKNDAADTSNARPAWLEVHHTTAPPPKT
ncbi:MAG: LacI family transcriptional regulator [Caulobacterales bacterium]|nr:LacI family transcriptional regulator [Caulobacterales bacterium]